MKQEYQDRIDAYLLGRMSEDEKFTFEKEVSQNDELKEQLEFAKSVHTAIVSRNKKIAEIREWGKAYQEYREERKVATIKPMRRYFYWLSGIAAIVVVGFFVFSNYPLGGEAELGLPIPMNENTLRGGEDHDAIIQLINKADFTTAMSQIDVEEKLLKTELDQLEKDKANIDDEEYIYRQEVIKSQMDELLWMKAYTLIGLKRNGEAIPVLDKLRKVEGLYQSFADSLYRKCNKH